MSSTLPSLPADFVSTTDARLCCALQQTDSEVSIRINPSKPYAHPYTLRVPWCEDGFYLSQRPSFTLDPAFAAGAYYVQEASSMFVGWLVDAMNLSDSPSVLDLCASPGGKSTLISSKIGDNGVLIANEVIRSRASVLAQNVQKWGDGNTIVTSADATVFGALGQVFDLLVADVPCSGEGMFRKDPSSRKQWSADGVQQCAARGRRIVADAWDSLRQGGYLIYSTCTFNEYENERNALWIASQLGGELVEPDIGELVLAGVSKNPTAGYNFYPHMLRGEGFYVALIRKTESFSASGSASYRKSDRMGGRGSKTTLASVKLSDRYTKRPMFYVPQGESLRAYGAELAQMVERLRAGRVFMLSAGVELGVEIRGVLKPSHELSLYSGMREGLFEKSELPLDAAQEYMRKGDVDASLLCDGVNLICYEGLPIGFAKRIASRVNNMYPTSWRVLK